MAMPGKVVMRRPALAWALRERTPFIGDDLKEYLAEYYALTPEELAQAHPKDGKPVFSNRVDFVTAFFTEMNVTTGTNGQAHTNPNDPYWLTRYGVRVAESKVPWPTKQRHGQPGQLPDEEFYGVRFPRKKPRDENG
jgi:hypothetical protein